MTVKKVDVFISGAGPIGLFFAYQMALLGHSIYIVDPKVGPTTQSRALLVTSRTMEIMESKDLAADFLAEACVSKGTQIWTNGHIVGQLDCCGDTPHVPVVILPQVDTEKIFNKRLESDTESKVLWETELVSYVQDDEKVTSTVRNIKTGEEETIESKYIVGADGSHSRVRKGNKDWTYEGVSVKTKLALADVQLTGEGIEDLRYRFNMMTLGSDLLGVVRIKSAPKEDGTGYMDIFRLFGNMGAYERGEINTENPDHGILKNIEEAPPSLETFQGLLDRFAAHSKLTASNLIWSSYFKVNERIANGYRRQRAFLAGDAAHCHSPFGGQGMNLGLQDADNLAWKMSLVLRGLSTDPEKLLDSYNAERFPIAKATIKATSSATETGLTGGVLFGHLRTFAIATAMKVPQIRTFAFKNLMQQELAIHPDTSNILGTSSKGLIEVGHFIPSTDTLRKAIFPTSKTHRAIQRYTLRDILTPSQQTAVIYIGTYHPNAPTRGNSNLLVEKFWTSTRPYPVKRVVIQSSWNFSTARYPDYVQENEQKIAEESFFTEERIDLSNSITKQVGLLPFLTSGLFSASVSSPPGVVLVVRPDFYISHACLVSNEADLATSLGYISSMFKASDSTGTVDSTK